MLWLSPVYPSPQDDNGYDISDYQDIDPVFGTLADFDALLAAVHERGMRLVMDLVVNHTSDEHPWFVEARSAPDSPKRDWYWWRPPRDGMAAGAPGAEPTNWGSAFSGSAWELDEASGEYYLHLFSRKQPDLNWENPAVREAVYAMMRWWLDRGVDGFRMDVINIISKDPACPTAPCRRRARRSRDALPFVNCGPRIHEFLQEMHREVFAGREDRLLTVGEMPGVTVEEAQLFTDPARAEVDMVFQFEHVNLDQGALEVGRRGRCGCSTSRRRSGAGRPASPSAAGTASTGTTTTSRASCRASATTASTGCAARRCSARSCTCTAARRTSTRARSSG